MDGGSSPQSANPPYDVIILGASGFTGKYVVREALKFLNPQSPSSPLKSLALAGRNPSKISAALNWASHPNPPPPSVAILAADTSDPSSLRRLCSQTKLLLNCVGPFRLYGDPVMAACVAAGCDYLDISGESEFIETAEVKHHEQAVVKGSLVVSACGFDSVPAELGWMFNSNQWSGPSAPNRIEAYLSLQSQKKKRIIINFGTYESKVAGSASRNEWMEMRSRRPARPMPTIPGPVPGNGPVIDHQKEFGLWTVEAPLADSLVVRRTLTTLAEHPKGLPGGDGESVEQKERREKFWSEMKPAHFDEKFGTKSLSGILGIIAVDLILGVLGRTSVGRWLLLKFPSFFSLGWFRKEGPSEDEIASASFEMSFIGRGYNDSSRRTNKEEEPDVEIITRVVGPAAGYVTTPIVLVQCALIVLGQRESLPKGGVFTPGIVFGATDLQQRLQQNGISFDVISRKNLPTH